MKFLTGVFVALLLCSPVYGQQPATQPVAAQPAATDVSPTTVALPADVSGTTNALEAAKDVLTEGKVVITVANEYFTGSKDGDEAAKKLGLFALITAILKLLLSLLKLTGAFWKEDRGKWVLRVVTLTLGIVVAVVSSLAAGMPWWDAVFLGLSGPGAVALHEYQKLIPALNKKKKA